MADPAGRGLRPVRAQAEDFDPAAEIDALAAEPGTGGIASFIGVVRSDPARPLRAMTLEHYPAMTERALRGIAEAAERRFAVRARIVHRYGRLLPGERIVLAAAGAPHRQAAFSAAAFLMDWLKTSAPFWKHEEYLDGTSGWVAARSEDDAAALRWNAAIR